MKNTLLLLAMLLLSGELLAQYKPPPNTQKPPSQTQNNQQNNNPKSNNALQGSKNFTDRIIYGGNLGGNLNGNGYVFDISPFIGYRFLKSKKLSVGAGPIFQQASATGQTLTRYGARVFGRYDVWNNPMVYAHSELQYLRASLKAGSYKETANLPTFLVGAGARFGGFASGEILYDLLWSLQDKDLRPALPYMVRFGVGF
jgi:hypothetical protein